MKKVQAVLKNELPVYIVDAEKNNKIIEALKVNGFPEIIVVDKNRRVHKFNGPREAPKIVQFIRQYKWSYSPIISYRRTVLFIFKNITYF